LVSGSPRRPLPNKPTSSRMTVGRTILGTMTGSGMLLAAHSPQLRHAPLRFRAPFFQTSAFFSAGSWSAFDRAGWSTPAAGLLFPGRGRTFFGRSLFSSRRASDRCKKCLNCGGLLRRRSDSARKNSGCHWSNSFYVCTRIEATSLDQFFFKCQPSGRATGFSIEVLVGRFLVSFAPFRHLSPTCLPA